MDGNTKRVVSIILFIIGVVSFVEFWNVANDAAEIEVTIEGAEDDLGQLVEALLFSWLSPILTLMAQIQMVSVYAVFLLPLGFFGTFFGGLMFIGSFFPDSRLILILEILTLALSVIFVIAGVGILWSGL